MTKQFNRRPKPEPVKITINEIGKEGEVVKVSLLGCDPYTTGPTLCEHLTRTGSMQTPKKQRAQVENLEKARKARKKKNEIEIYISDRLPFQEVRAGILDGLKDYAEGKPCPFPSNVVWQKRAVKKEKKP